MFIIDGANTSKKAAPAPGATMIVTIKAGQGQVVKEGVTEIHYGVHEEEGPWINVKQGALNNFYGLGDVVAFSVVIVEGEEAVCWG